MTAPYALITGGSSGIGEAFAHQLARRGWPLIIVSNRREENRRVAALIGQRYGVDVQQLTLDLCRPEAAEELVAWLDGWNLEVGLLVSNAGMLQFSTLQHTSCERIRELVALHCNTPSQLCRLLGERMAQKRRGYILLVSSLTAWMPYPTISLYAATKGYLKLFGEALWHEMRPKGVQVTTLFPSAVDTPLYPLEERMRHRLLRWGVMLTAERVAEAGVKALLKGRRRSLPGFWCKLFAGIAWLMPAHLLTPILKLPRVKAILDRV